MRLGEISAEQIECLICHRRMRFIVTHLPVHGLTVEEYRVKFPGVVLCSQSIVKERADALTGVPKSEEMKRNMSKAKTGQKYPLRIPGHCLKLSERQKGRPKGHGESVSAAMKKYFQTEAGLAQAAEHSRLLTQRFQDDPESFQNFIEAGRECTKWRDTEPELRLAKILDELGLKYEPQGRVKELGSPHNLHPWDFVLRKEKVLCEADGCLFHLCPTCDFPVKGEFRESLEKGCRKADERDLEADLSGWTVLRCWECEILSVPTEVAECVRRAVECQRRVVA